jgi:ribosome-associated protein
VDLGGGLVVPAREIQVRATTPGGPGGQHANRTMSRIVVSFDVAHAESLDERRRARLLAELGPVVSASASGSRSQAQNRLMALERLARRLAEALHEDPARRATRPTRASVGRRLEDKSHRSRVKSERRRRDDD